MELKAATLARKCCDPDCMSTVARTEFDDSEVTARTAVFNALGDEIRLKMVRLLAQHEALCVCELQQAFDIGQPTISHHLKVLREADLVDVQRRGTWAYYSLRKAAVKDLMQELVKVI